MKDIDDLSGDVQSKLSQRIENFEKRVEDSGADG